MVGLVDGGALGYWQIIKPLATTNLVTNPSFEVGTTGWTPTNAGFTRIIGGRHGAWCGRHLGTSSSTHSDFTISGPSSTMPLTLSADVWSDTNSVQLAINGGGGAQVNVPHPGDSQWHRLECTVSIPSGTPSVALQINDSRLSGWTPVLIDGVLAEWGVTVASTYADGDQDGCSWTGQSHASTSTRDGRDGRGGQVVSLDSVGLRITGWKGSGAPPVDVATQTLALGDGELYQRSTAKSRVLTLQGLIIGDTTGLPSWHAQRRGIIDLFRPDGRTNRGPITLRYTGPTVSKRLQTYYQGGLEMDSLDAADEKPEIKMLAPQPDWQGETEESAVLTGSTALTVGGIALRSPDHVWSALDSGFGTTGTQFVERVVRMPSGKIVAVGTFLNMGAVSSADFAAVWSPDTATWSDLGSTPSARVRTAYVAADGTLYLGGDFANYAGIAAADGIAKLDATLVSASAVGSAGVNTGGVYAIIQDPATGNIFAAGSFTTMGGVSITAGIASWNGAAWSDVSVSAAAFATDAAFAIGPDGTIFHGSGAHIHAFDAATGQFLPHSTLSGAAVVHSMVAYRGRLYAAGEYVTITHGGSISTPNFSLFNGTTWEAALGGITGTRINRLAVGTDGLLYVAGRNITAFGGTGGLVVSDPIAAWNGSQWVQIPFNPPATGTSANDEHYVFALSDGSLVFSWGAASGTFGSAAIGEGITALTNSGSANAYPVLRLIGSGNVYGLTNVTTGQEIRFLPFDASLYGAMTLDLRPGRKTFTGAAGQNLLNKIAPGSSLATFCLAPGANSIALLIDTPSSPYAYWRPMYWSAD